MNVLIMGWVNVAMITLLEGFFGMTHQSAFLWTGVALLIVVFYVSVSGLKGVVYTVVFQFVLAMSGSIALAYYVLKAPEIGGLAGLRAALPEETFSFLPSVGEGAASGRYQISLASFLAFFGMVWWTSWYPGAEPGGGGYIAQRMLAAKDENHAIGATFFFNIMHYAIRPWPWIIVALASLVIFPDLASIQEAFPNVTENKLGHDLAYSAMLTMLPSGLLGLVLTSLIAAYMSTISTQLNWGSSYMVYDFYKQQVNPKASEKTLVFVGRISTALLMVISAVLALFLQNALQLFELLLVFGAGTGLIFILRWF